MSRRDWFGEPWTENWCVEANRRAEIAARMLALGKAVYVTPDTSERPSCRWKHGVKRARLLRLKADYYFIVKPDGYATTLSYHPMFLRILPSKATRSRGRTR
jgi:hypothetical protein